MQRSSFRSVAAVCLLIIVLAGMLWSSGAVTLGEAAERMRSPGGALLSLGMMALAALSAFPAEAVALANGMVYGPLLGTAMTWSGAMLGACLAYGVARWMAPEPGPVLARIQAAADDPWALLTIRLIPLFPFFLVNYACGLAGVPRWRFVWTTAVGILPLSIVLSGVGEGLATQPLLVLPILGLAAIAGTITVLRRRR